MRDFINMISDKPFLLYTLPKSRTTQQLNGGRKIEKAWEIISNFLINCSTSNPIIPASISLTAYSANQDDSNPELADRIINEITSIFGSGKRTPLGYFYPSGIPHEQTKTDWDLSVDKFSQVLCFMIDGQPWPKFTFGPIELLISYNFKLVNPLTKTELPNQNHDSRLLVWFSRSNICSPDLYFPFESANMEFYNYLNTIEPYLPFKLEQKYLRLGKPNKKRDNYTYTKI